MHILSYFVHSLFYWVHGLYRSIQISRAKQKVAADARDSSSLIEQWSIMQSCDGVILAMVRGLVGTAGGECSRHERRGGDHINMRRRLPRHAANAGARAHVCCLCTLNISALGGF